MLMVFLKPSGSNFRHPLSTGAEQGRLCWPKSGTSSAFLGVRAWAGGSGWMAKCLSSHPSAGPVLCGGMRVRKFA